MILYLLILIIEAPGQKDSVQAKVENSLESAALTIWAQRKSNPNSTISGKTYLMDLNTVKIAEVPLPEVEFNVKKNA